ncbi:cation:proton antiporter [Luteolibacter yonseiensis]|uniref:Cation:proton antiporter n=1 Tax=Luteolibacter yonseiensis TaxID=1144680 RepID=A0A934VC12_9BACT|nr:cation:proton antiporter [Luteolibacter yonseiensis]MBK1817838.1 cation:proton antiporter [Luteolibacter yonseiensis]
MVAMILKWFFMASGVANISPLFALLTLVLVLAVLISLILVKFKQSLLVGYLLSGVLIGNVGLMWVTGIDKGDAVIMNFAEIGVVLLMFTLGIEFSLSEFKHLWRTALIGGGLQVGITAGIVGLVAAASGFPTADSIVFGVAVALSSTAVAMMSFQDLGQQNNPGARASLGIALFQDILVIVFFLVMPALYGQGEGSVAGQIGKALLKGGLFLAGAWLLGRYGLTPLLHAVARTRSRELFTLTVIGLCAGVAFAGGALNLSLALGAFAAGLVVSESIYSHRILSDILPFKDLFLAIFFISVGLLIDLSTIASDWGRVLLGSALILILKSVVVFSVLKWIRIPGRPALLAAGSLASTGEFSLVLIGKAGGYRPFDPGTEQMLLVCTAVTMAVVPSLMRGAGPLGKWLEKKGVMGVRKIAPEGMTPAKAIKGITDHAIICGYGPVGKSLNEALKRCGVDTLVMELNSDTVRALKSEGQPVLFADATHSEALDLAGIKRARLVAFTFPSVRTTSIAVPLVRERNSGIFIFGRAKFSGEVKILRELGVQVIHDERESAVSMVRAALSSYQREDVDPEEVVGDTMEA